MTSPLVSVLLPVRDGAAFVAEAINSILAQTLHAFELLVVDDGSRDATPRSSNVWPRRIGGSAC